MAGTRKTIVFFNRAYNDLDVQLPLIDAFAQDSRFSVRVVAYPCDGEISVPDVHEAVSYMKHRMGVTFESLTDSAYAPYVLKVLYRIQSLAMRWRKKTSGIFSSIPARTLNIFARRSISFFLRSLKSDWMAHTVEEWCVSAAVVDEAFAQPGRSFFLDSVLSALCQNSVPCYMILTGHRVYKKESPTGSAPPPYRKTSARLFFVPNTLNASIYASLFPGETLLAAGNLRMDRSWLRKLSEEVLAPPFYDPSASGRLPASGEIKIVVMLSKLSYGVDTQALRNTLSTLGRLSGVVCAIKPHTRGMKFDFMSREEMGRSFPVDNTPSTILMNWADLVLFTGSSVVFHAALLGKPVGFLKYCQSLETIFDAAPACLCYESLEGLIADIEEFRQTRRPFLSDAKLKASRDWLNHEVYNADSSGLTAQAYKRIILEDMSALAQSGICGTPIS
jgi:hypothetical protein